MIFLKANVKLIKTSVANIANSHKHVWWMTGGVWSATQDKARRDKTFCAIL